MLGLVLTLFLTADISNTVSFVNTYQARDVWLDKNNSQMLSQFFMFNDSFEKIGNRIDKLYHCKIISIRSA